MSNSFFRFKQFVVNQDKTAMKVGVDAVILGSWANPGNVLEILDIGTGTGLLSLMMAQKTNASITAVEIENDAYIQALENVRNSPWHHRIEVRKTSLQEFAAKSGKRFDFIVCNPPYFSNSLVSGDKVRTLARHDDSIALPELLDGVNRLLDTGGRFIMIYPYLKKDILIHCLECAGLYPAKILEIKGTEAKMPNRIVIESGREREKAIVYSLIVRDSITNDYTTEYKKLTTDFYLKF